MYPSQAQKLKFMKEHAIENWDELNTVLHECRDHIRQDNSEKNGIRSIEFSTGHTPPHSVHLASPSPSQHRSSQSNTQNLLKYRQLRVLINQYIQAHSDASPNNQLDATSTTLLNALLHPSKIAQISDQTGLSRQKVRRATKGLLTKGTITRQKKNYIKEWIEGNLNSPYERPTEEQMQHLMNQMSLNRVQINSIFYSLQDVKGDITPENKKRIQHLMQKNGTQWVLRNMFPIMEETGLGRAQLRNIVYRLHDTSSTRSKHIPQKAIKQIYEHIKENDLQKPSSHQLQKWRNEHRLSRMQLHNLVYRLINNRRGEINQKARHIIQQWIASHNGAKPDSMEIKTLSEQTGLSPKQLYAIFRRLTNRDGTAGEITDEKREYIRSAVFGGTNGGNGESATKESTERNGSHKYNLHHLAQKTDLQKTQVSSIIYALKNPPGSLTEDKKCIILDRIQGENLNLREIRLQILSELEPKLQLNKSQIRNFIAQHNDPIRKLTREKRERVMRLLEEKEGSLTHKEVKRLAQDCDLSVRQVQNLVRATSHRQAVERSPVERQLSRDFQN
eukprot:CAMPEP_0117454498 /NCGR_PEP_ID=MMETSP0759-20121206/10828_1 /TAXON_ID=63605 /ORGANISM="Percolomonas cosmopolitus, Strain WS" /LENGTH=559 /DNA_ID=CAMNT_0005247679 /DNA_START=144 /DNA_END=1823 /DNA_ORIENTATION=-